MAMVVKNNMSAISTLNTLNKNQSALKSSLEKVSSGMKINSAQDDASGYAISERMRAMIRSLDQANENTQNGNSLMKVAEGAVSKTVEILDTLKKKAIQAATDTNTDDDRATIQKEIDQLIDQIDENALVTYNGKYLLDGSKTQAGAATYTAMTNQKLDESTDFKTRLIDLNNRKGESLQIIKTDQVQASFVRNGKTYTTTFKVGTHSLEDIFERLNDEAVAQGSTKGFGVANIYQDKVKEMDISSATTKITAGPGTDSTVFQKLIDKDEEYTIAAMKLDKEGKIGAAQTSAVTYQDYDDAKTDLKTMITKYFSDYTIVAEDTNSAKIVTTLGFTMYDADGESETKKYDFTVEPTAATAVNLSDCTTTFDGMITDLMSSIENLLKQGTKYDADITDSDTTDAVKAVQSDASKNLVTAITNALKMTSADIAVTGKDNSDTSAAKDAEAKFQNNASTKVDIAKAKATTAKKSTATDAVDTPGATARASAGATVADALNFAAANDASTDTIDSTWLSSKDTVANLFTNNLQRYADGFVLDKLLDGKLVNDSIDIGWDPADAMVKTANREIGLTVTAKSSGIDDQISGLTIKIMDAQAQSRTAINEVLDAFGTTIFASSKSDDLTLKLHTGAEAGQALSVGLSDMRASALGLKGNDSEKVSVATQAQANAALSVFNNALQKALDIQTTIGAIEARLNYTSDNLTTATENITASESTIRDADMAKEMTEYTKNNVLLQAAQSMLAQANQNSSAVLSLLQ